MGNEVAAQQGIKAAVGMTAVPEHLKAAMAAAGVGNIREGVVSNTLTFGGKTWKMTINGETKVLQRPDPETGEMENVQVVQVVVLDQSDRGRNFYDQGFDDANPKAPDCWSADGKKPHASVEAPQCTTCGACPKAIKGSKVVDGKEMIACSGFKLLVVQPVKMIAGKPNVAHDFPPMRLKLAPTSIWDEQDEESANAGWYGWDNFTKLMRAQGAQWTNASVVRMRFANVNYPKVQFARGEYLSAEDFHKTHARAQQDDVKALLAGFTARPKSDEAPKGKALPPDEPVGDPVFTQKGQAAIDAQAAESARLAEAAKLAEAAALKVAYDAGVAQKAAEAAKKAADAKAKKLADAKRLLAEAEAESGGFDDVVTAPTAPVVAAAPIDTPPPAKNTAPPVVQAAPASAPAEVPQALTAILGDWD